MTALLAKEKQPILNSQRQNRHAINPVKRQTISKLKRTTLNLPALTFSALIISHLALSGCAVTTAGLNPKDERNLVRSVNDASINQLVRARLKRAYGFNLKNVNVDVAEGIVVLSGSVPTEIDRLEAVNVAWSAPNVIHVGNEIIIANKQSPIRNIKDGILNKSIMARLLADESVKSLNYTVDVYNGTVFLLGVARSPQELERATYIARTTKGAQKIISYVRVHGDTSEITFGGSNTDGLKVGRLKVNNLKTDQTSQRPAEKPAYNTASQTSWPAQLLIQKPGKTPVSFIQKP